MTDCLEVKAPARTSCFHHDSSDVHHIKPHITDLSVKCNWLRTHSLCHYKGDECHRYETLNRNTKNITRLVYKNYHQTTKTSHQPVDSRCYRRQVHRKEEYDSLVPAASRFWKIESWAEGCVVGFNWKQTSGKFQDKPLTGLTLSLKISTWKKGWYSF